MSVLVGRHPERRQIVADISSGRASFIALYGRRRVGKTFLIREIGARPDVRFVEATGQKDADTAVQLNHFRESLALGFGQDLQRIPNWDEAFRRLTALVEAETGPVLVFLDELPWMARPRSGLLQALDYWWNARLSRVPNLTLVVCGSAAGWMVDKLIQARGGLHNRVTRQINLQPFTVPETREFLRTRGSRMGLRQVVDLYMAVGGVPYYLEHVEAHHSATQAIQALCFERDGVLRNEFSRLFSSLFDDGLEHERIMRTLAGRRVATTRTELVSALGTTSGGGLAKKLNALRDAGFIDVVTPYDHKRRNIAYRVTDPYVFFHLRWMETAPRGVFELPDYWMTQATTQSWRAWAGFAFETLCMQHASEVKTALGLGGVAAQAGGWRFVPTRSSRHQEGAQVDMLFDRADDVVTLCELKYVDGLFTVDKATARQWARKMEIFSEVTRTRKDVQLALVTTQGLKRNLWSEDLVAQVVDLEQLFGP